MTRPIQTAALAAFLLVAVWPAVLPAAVVRKLDLDGLCRHAVLVVEGTCLESKCVVSGTKHRRISTLTRIAVTSAYKGAAKGDVWVRTPGGRVGDLVQAVAGAPTFRKGETVMLFLWRTRGGSYVPVGYKQGKFTAEKDRKKQTWFRSDLSGLVFYNPARSTLTRCKEGAFRRMRAGAFRKAVRTLVARHAREAEEARAREGK